VLPLGAKVQVAATAAVGPRLSGVSSLWTLQLLRFEPDVAAVPTDRVENHDPGQQHRRSTSNGSHNILKCAAVLAAIKTKPGGGR
jgi:hypothetical protein